MHRLQHNPLGDAGGLRTAFGTPAPARAIDTKLTPLLLRAACRVQDYHAFFPSFVWVVRDFSLQLLEGGREITPNEQVQSPLRPPPLCTHRSVALQ